MMVYTTSLVSKSDTPSESSQLVRNTNSGSRPTELESPRLRDTRLNSFCDLYFVSSTCGNFPFEESPTITIYSHRLPKRNQADI